MNAPAAPHRAAGQGQAATRKPGSTGASQATVQSRNAGASICSGLPAANPDPGVP